MMRGKSNGGWPLRPRIVTLCWRHFMKAPNSAKKPLTVRLPTSVVGIHLLGTRPQRTLVSCRIQTSLFSSYAVLLLSMASTITLMLVTPKPMYLALTQLLSTRSPFLFPFWSVYISMSHRHLSLHISQVEPSVFPANLVPLLALPIWRTSFTMALISEVRSPGVIPDTSASSGCHVQLLTHSVSWPYAGSSFLCTVTPRAAPAAGLNHHLPLPWAPSFWPLPAGVQS